MPQAKKMPSSGLDAMAREKGFPNYAAWKAWNDKYRKPVTNVQKGTPVKNFFQTLTDTIPIQFASRRVVSTLKKANKK